MIQPPVSINPAANDFTMIESMSLANCREALKIARNCRDSVTDDFRPELDRRVVVIQKRFDRLTAMNQMLTNDEASTDTELIEHFVTEVGISRAEATEAVANGRLKIHSAINFNY